MQTEESSTVVAVIVAKLGDSFRQCVVCLIVTATLALHDRGSVQIIPVQLKLSLSARSGRQQAFSTLELCLLFLCLPQPPIGDMLSIREAGDCADSMPGASCRVNAAAGNELASNLTVKESFKGRSCRGRNVWAVPYHLSLGDKPDASTFRRKSGISNLRAAGSHGVLKLALATRTPRWGNGA